MTQRLPGISDAEATGVAKDTLAGSTRLLGRSSNLLRILSAHTPYLARATVADIECFAGGFAASGAAQRRGASAVAAE